MNWLLTGAFALSFASTPGVSAAGLRAASVGYSKGGTRQRQEVQAAPAPAPAPAAGEATFSVWSVASPPAPAEESAEASQSPARAEEEEEQAAEESGEVPVEEMSEEQAREEREKARIEQINKANELERLKEKEAVAKAKEEEAKAKDEQAKANEEEARAAEEKVKEEEEVMQAAAEEEAGESPADAEEAAEVDGVQEKDAEANAAKEISEAEATKANAARESLASPENQGTTLQETATTTTPAPVNQLPESIPEDFFSNKKWTSCSPPCIEGRGVCNDNTCFCKSPYRGSTCQKMVKGDQMRISYSILAGVVGISLFVGYIAANALFLYFRYQDEMKANKLGELKARKEEWSAEAASGKKKKGNA